MSLPTPAIARATIVMLALAAATLAGCAPRAPERKGTLTWYAGRARPAFDPDGPADALRVTLERHLSRGLVERARDGTIEPVLAESIACSPDSLVWTFRLRDGVRFTDGTPVTSAHLRDALEAGLGRDDHATRAWLLGAVKGVRDVRAGRALPALGLEAPDPRTLRLRLATVDRRLLEKLAVPGVTTPWKARKGEWGDVVGVGPYQVASAGERDLVLVAASPVAGVAAGLDTLRVRFEIGAPRALSMLRHAAADVLWPLPANLLERPLPDDWTVEREETVPERRLLLVLRADVPPLTRASARQGLAHALNREELLAALGTRGAPLRRWLTGASVAYDWPRLETPAERSERLAAEARSGPAPAAMSARARARERLSDRIGSHHIVLAFDADLSGAEVAPAVQGQWERAGHYVDVRALRGPAAAAEALRAAAAQAQLVEAQAPFPGLEAELAMLVMPLRGPAVGSFRTGWRTREYDRWIPATGTAAAGDADAVQAVLAADRIVLPLAALRWQLAVRDGVGKPAVHPAYGPEWIRRPGGP